MNPDSVIRWQRVHVHMCACALFMCTRVHACMSVCLCACISILSVLNLNPRNSKIGSYCVIPDTSQKPRNDLGISPSGKAGNT